MNTTYDVIVLGTGLKECMLAGLLAKFPKKTPGEEKKRRSQNSSIRQKRLLWI